MSMSSVVASLTATALSDAEIDELVSTYEVEDLDSTQAWMAYYNKIAAKIKPRYTSALAMQLDFTRIVKVALDKKYDDIRFGFRRFAARVGVVALSTIPGGKLLFMTGNTIAFADRALKQFGMGEHADVMRYHQEACSKGGLVTNFSDFKRKLLEDIPKEFALASGKAIWEDPEFHQRFMDFLNEEFGKEFAMHAVEEGVHAKVGLGQVISAVRGWTSFGGQTAKALGHVRDLAAPYHLQVLATVAVANNSPPLPRPTRLVSPSRANNNSAGSWVSDNAVVLATSLVTGYFTGRYVDPRAAQGAWNAWNRR